MRALVEVRAAMPIAGERIFLNHAGQSPLPGPAIAAVRRAAAGLRDRRGADRDWVREAPARYRALVGATVDVDPSRVAIVPSTGFGLSLLAQAIRWRPGDNVVGVPLEFPANVYPWLNLERHGVAYRRAEVADGRVEVERIADAIDARTRVVALSHVQFLNGYRADLAAIGALCRERGIVFAVDAIQSVGALRTPLGSLPVDFAAAGAYKWTMGPNGCGFCCWSPGLVEQLGAAGGVPWEAASARRDDDPGASLLTVSAAEASLRLLLDAGMAEVERAVLRHAERLAALLAAAGCVLAPPWPRRREEQAGIVAFRVPGVPSAETLAALAKVGVVARVHGEYVRLSTHCWNSEAELERTAAVAAGLRRRDM